MNRFALFFIVAVVLSGCANTESVPQRIALLHQGMTQQEVTALLGKPRVINNQGALMIYEYVFTQAEPYTSYYVIVGRDGRVRSFGPN